MTNFRIVSQEEYCKNQVMRLRVAKTQQLDAERLSKLNSETFLAKEKKFKKKIDINFFIWSIS